MDNFTQIPFTKENLDRYFIRTSILKAISGNLKHFKGKLLDVGCGKMPYKQYILDNSKVKTYEGIDIDYAKIYDRKVKPDYYWDGNKMPFETATYDTIIATEVLEHAPQPEVILNEIFRILRSDGIFFFTTPFLWNLHEVPHDEYRFTPFALKRLLEAAGFQDVELKAGGGWHASMAQMLGLWVRRSPMRTYQKNFLSRLLKPIIMYLIKKDEKIGYSYEEEHMITNLYGYARKG